MNKIVYIADQTWNVEDYAVEDSRGVRHDPLNIRTGSGAKLMDFFNAVGDYEEVRLQTGDSLNDNLEQVIAVLWPDIDYSECDNIAKNKLLSIIMLMLNDIGKEQNVEGGVKQDSNLS